MLSLVIIISLPSLQLFSSITFCHCSLFYLCSYNRLLLLFLLLLLPKSLFLMFLNLQLLFFILPYFSFSAICCHFSDLNSAFLFLPATPAASMTCLPVTPVPSITFLPAIPEASTLPACLSFLKLAYCLPTCHPLKPAHCLPACLPPLKPAHCLPTTPEASTLPACLPPLKLAHCLPTCHPLKPAHCLPACHLLKPAHCLPVTPVDCITFLLATPEGIKLPPSPRLS